MFVLKIRKETRIQGLKSGCAIRSKNTDGSTTFVRIFTLPCLMKRKKYIGAANFMRILCGCFFRMRAGGTIDDFLKYKEKSAAGKNPSGAESAKAVLCGEDNK